MVKLKDLRVGSVVMVRGNFGSGRAVRAVVESVEAAIKNGRLGIDYTAVGAAAGAGHTSTRWTA